MTDIDLININGIDYFHISIIHDVPNDTVKRVKTVDTQEDIDKCLCCSKPDCCDCIGYRYVNTEKNRVDDSVLMKLIEQGIRTSSEVAEYFRVPERTARFHIRKVERMVYPA